jgi:hypothetical protein
MIPIASAKAQLGHHLLTKAGVSFAPSVIDRIVDSISICLYTSPDHFDAAWTLIFAHLCQATDPSKRDQHLALAHAAAQVASEISSLSPQKELSLSVFNQLKAALASWPLPPAELSQLASAVIASEAIEIDMMVDKAEEFHVAESMLQSPSSARADAVRLPTHLSSALAAAKLPLIINQFRRPPSFIEFTENSLNLHTDRPVSVSLVNPPAANDDLDLFGQPGISEPLQSIFSDGHVSLEGDSKPLKGVRIALDPAFVGGIKHKDIDATGGISVRDDEGIIHNLDVGYLNLATAMITKHQLELQGAEVMLTRTLEKDHAASLDFYEWLDTDDGAGARRAVRYCAGQQLFLSDFTE